MYYPKKLKNMSDYSNEHKPRFKNAVSASDVPEPEMATQVLENYAQVEKRDINIDGKHLPAWRVVHNRALGPGKGGVRFHKDLLEEEVKSLALWMSIKTSLIGLPYGGAKGGVAVDVPSIDTRMKERISRAYVDNFYSVIGPDLDIPAPDVYTNEQVMGWMLDQYEKHIGYHSPGAFTGKPYELGGCLLRSNATSKGGLIVLKSALADFEDTSAVSVAVQGFGNVGSNIALILQEAGYKVVGVSDSGGGVYSEDGLDVEKVKRVKAEEGSVAKYSEGRFVENQELLELPVDILVLGALEYQVTAQNADNVKAKYILELANGPVSYEAERNLFERDVIILPDVLSNTGGVLVSYFEWSQNKTGQILEMSYLEKRLREIIEDAWKRVFKKYKEKNSKFDLRTIAYSLALERIILAEKWRGNV